MFLSEKKKSFFFDPECYIYELLEQPGWNSDTSLLTAPHCWVPKKGGCTHYKAMRRMSQHRTFWATSLKFLAALAKLQTHVYGDFQPRRSWNAHSEAVREYVCLYSSNSWRSSTKWYKWQNCDTSGLLEGIWHLQKHPRYL